MGVLYEPICNYDANFGFLSYFHIMMKINGCWPVDDSASSCWYHFLHWLYKFWFWFLAIGLGLLIFAELMFFVVNIDDILKVTQNMATVLVNIMVWIRMLHVQYRMRTLRKLLRMFAEKIWINKQTHPTIFERCIKHTKPTYYISFLLWTVIAIYTAMPIVEFFTGVKSLDSGDKAFPYAMIFPYDLQQISYYIFTYTFTSYFAFVTVALYYAMDALLALFISFLSGQFDVLHGEILRLVPECHAEWVAIGCVEDLQKLQDMYTKRLHELAKHHDDIISFSLEMSEFFSFPLLINMLTSSLLIAVGCFQFLISGANSVSEFLRLFLYLVGITGQLCVICRLGTLLIINSTDTARYLFLCNWEGGYISTNSPLVMKSKDMELDTLTADLPSWRYISYYGTGKDFRRKLSFMILRSHRPVQLTAMQFVDLSLESFTRIFSKSLSFFAVLKTFLDKQN